MVGVVATVPVVVTDAVVTTVAGVLVEVPAYEVGTLVTHGELRKSTSRTTGRSRRGQGQSAWRGLAGAYGVVASMAGTDIVEVGNGKDGEDSKEGCTLRDFHDGGTRKETKLWELLAPADDFCAPPL